MYPSRGDNGGKRRGGGGLKNENRWPNRLWDETPAVAGVGSIQKRQQSAPPYYVFSSTLPLTNPTYLFCYPSTSPPLFALNPPNPLLPLPLLLFQPPQTRTYLSPWAFFSTLSPLSLFLLLCRTGRFWRPEVPLLPLSTRGNWISVFFFLSLVLSLSLSFRFSLSPLKLHPLPRYLELLSLLLLTMKHVVHSRNFSPETKIRDDCREFLI